MVKVNLSLRSVENNILIPLNEVLLLSYGTDTYRQILLQIEKIVRELENQHSASKMWQ